MTTQISFQPGTISFIVKNISTLQVHAFNYRITPGLTLDLMKIPGISEEDIKQSLLKGELYYKFKAGQLQLISTTILFTTTDPGYQSFLTSIGISVPTLDSSGKPAVFAKGSIGDDSINPTSQIALSSGITLRRYSSIWWVGDSLTAGTGSLAGTRERLWTMLRQKRGDIRFVGSQTGAATSRVSYALGAWDHDGWPGYTIEQINSNISNWYSVINTVPDIGILTIGNNNVADGYVIALTKLATLLTTLSNLNKTTKWIITTITRSPSDVNFSPSYNSGIYNIVAAAGSQFTFVDTFSSLTAGDYSAIGDAHPNDAGYALAANTLMPYIDAMLPRSYGLPFTRQFRKRFNQTGLTLSTNAKSAHVSGSQIEIGANNFFAAVTYQASSLASGDNIIMAYGDILTHGYLVCQSGTGGNLKVYWKGAAIITVSGAILSTSKASRIVLHGDQPTGQLSIYVDGILRGISAAQTPWAIVAGEKAYLGTTGYAGGAVGSYDNWILGSGSSVPRYRATSSYTANIGEAVESDYFEGVTIPGSTSRYLLNEPSGTSLADQFGGSAGVTDGTFGGIMVRDWNDLTATSA